MYFLGLCWWHYSTIFFKLVAKICGFLKWVAARKRLSNTGLIKCGSGSGGSGPFSVEAEAEAEARIFYRFRFHIGGKNGERKDIGSAILRRRTNRGSINIKK